MFQTLRSSKTCNQVASNIADPVSLKDPARCFRVVIWVYCLFLFPPCLRENVVVTCKIRSFLCSVDILLQKNVIVFFFGKSNFKMALPDLKNGLFLTYFSHFLVTREKWQNFDFSRWSSILRRIYIFRGWWILTLFNFPTMWIFTLSALIGRGESWTNSHFAVYISSENVIDTQKLIASKNVLLSFSFGRIYTQMDLLLDRKGLIGWEL